MRLKVYGQMQNEKLHRLLFSILLEITLLKNYEFLKLFGFAGKHVLSMKKTFFCFLSEYHHSSFTIKGGGLPLSTPSFFRPFCREFKTAYILQFFLQTDLFWWS